MLGGAESFASLRRAASALDLVSPAWWRLTVSPAAPSGWSLAEWDVGNPVDRAAVLAVARNANLPVLPLAACAGPCAAPMSATLADDAKRARLVTALAQSVSESGASGVFLDFRELKVSAAVFTTFVRELAAALHKQGHKLGLAVPEPCGIAPECRREGYPYALGDLARAADFLAVLHYDFAVDGSDAVAPRDWFTRGLRRVRANTGDARAQVYVGIPSYGRVTQGLTTDTAVLWRELRTKKIQGKKAKLGRRRFDEAKLSQVAAVRVGGKQGTVYFDDAQTTGRRLSLAEKEGFGNMALWRLGGEDPCTWDVVRAWKANQATDAVVCEGN